MSRKATSVLAAGALLLSTVAVAAPAQAVPSAPAAPERAVYAKGKFTGKHGKYKAFKNIKTSGSYEVTRDKIYVKFKVQDKKKDGWTPGIQFGAIEAWDIEDSGINFPLNKNRRNGRIVDPGPGSSGSIPGPKVTPKSDNSYNPSGGGGNKGGRGSTYKKPKKKKLPPNGPADGKYSYTFKKKFASSYTEGLFVREFLVKKKGKKFIYKKGPQKLVYFYTWRETGNPNDVRLVEANQLANQRTTAAKAALIRSADKRQISEKFGVYLNRWAAGQLVGMTGWGVFYGKRDGDTLYPQVVTRLRDDEKDGEFPVAILTFTNEAATEFDTQAWVPTYPDDKVGRWTNSTTTSKLTGHLIYEGCIGHRTTDGKISVTCGKAGVIY